MKRQKARRERLEVTFSLVIIYNFILALLSYSYDSVILNETT